MGRTKTPQLRNSLQRHFLIGARKWRSPCPSLQDLGWLGIKSRTRILLGTTLSGLPRSLSLITLRVHRLRLLLVRGLQPPWMQLVELKGLLNGWPTVLTPCFESVVHRPVLSHGKCCDAPIGFARAGAFLSIDPCTRAVAMYLCRVSVNKSFLCVRIVPCEKVVQNSLDGLARRVF